MAGITLVDERNDTELISNREGMMRAEAGEAQEASVSAREDSETQANGTSGEEAQVHTKEGSPLEGELPLVYANDSPSHVAQVNAKCIPVEDAQAHVSSIAVEDAAANADRNNPAASMGDTPSPDVDSVTSTPTKATLPSSTLSSSSIIAISSSDMPTSSSTTALASPMVSSSSITAVESSEMSTSSNTTALASPMGSSSSEATLPSSEMPHSSSTTAISPSAMLSSSKAALPVLTGLAGKAPRLSVTVRDFEFSRFLGNGSFSKVLLATYKGDGKEYALKVMAKQLIIREQKVKGVKRERTILDQLDHPGIVRMCFTFQDQTNLYMGMECCHGGELYDQTRRLGRLPRNVAQFYAAEVICILEYLHSKGVIHRDLKPENLLLTESGHLKLADFGSATVVRSPGIAASDGSSLVELPEGDDAADDSRNGSFVGSAEYISPEVLDSQPATSASDLWALGCVVFYMLEGKRPFHGASEYLTFQKVLRREFSFSPDSTLDEHAKDFINRLLQLNPTSRLGCAEQGGYGMIKDHPFFEGVNWKNLWEQKAPTPVQESSEEESKEDDSDGGSDESEAEDEEWTIARLRAEVDCLKT